LSITFDLWLHIILYRPTVLHDKYRVTKCDREVIVPSMHELTE